MRIELNDQGATVTTTITSTVFEFRRHNRAVDTAIFMSPGVRASSGGFFMLKTVISAKQFMCFELTELFSPRP